MIDGVSLLLLLFISLYVPFLISFNYETSYGFQYYEFFVDIWFLMEICINFFTGYYDKGMLIMNFSLIAKNYLKGYFFIDLVSSIPISFISI